ncbi:hypothetical protein HY229_05820 [Candidatus Acetothermia bacterium]|nr:hypothetical protein [Candidatus Acetothermia bacterium]MBI3643600.1 hypothetical protein [Candidatus Acetothermia bacterium]
MGQIIALGAGIVLMHELLRLILDRVAWKSVVFPKIRAKILVIRFFTILTFPFVILICLVSAIWMLPYLMLSRPYRAHLQKEAHGRTKLDWQGRKVSSQLSSLALPAFLTLPIKPISAFIEFLGKRKTTPWTAQAATRKSHSL